MKPKRMSRKLYHPALPPGSHHVVEALPVKPALRAGFPHTGNSSPQSILLAVVLSGAFAAAAGTLTVESSKDLSNPDILARKDALRADRLNLSYINWTYFNDRYANKVFSGNRFTINYALGKLRELDGYHPFSREYRILQDYS